jgi:predicted transcriptional regulator
MQRSKLELFEEVLTALSDKPLTIDEIAYACNMDCVALNKRLDFLIKNNLVEERAFNRETFYALTRRGLAIFKTLEITKRLEKLQTSIKIIEKTLRAIPAFPEPRKEANSK